MSILHSQGQRDHRGLRISLMQAEEEEEGGQDSHVPLATTDTWDRVPAFAWLPSLHPPPLPQLDSTFKLFLPLSPTSCPVEEDESSRGSFWHLGPTLAGRPLHKARGFGVGLEDVGEGARGEAVVMRGQAIMQRHRGRRRCQVPGNLELITD